MMLIGIFFFALNDALGKWLVATYSVGQLLLVRSVAGLVFLAPFVKREGWSSFADAPRPWVQFLRPLFSTLEVACFYWALAYMPLADVMTFYLAGPIYVTAVSPAAGRAGRMAALARRHRRFCRRHDRASPVSRFADAGGDGGDSRQRLVFHPDDPDPPGARHVRYRAGDDANRRRAAVRRGRGAVHLGGVELARYGAAGTCSVSSP